MAERIKTISTYGDAQWGPEIPIGADASNVDVTLSNDTTASLQSVLGTTPPVAQGSTITERIDSKVSISGGDVAATIVSDNIDNYDSSSGIGSDILTGTDASINTSTSTLWSRFNLFRKKVSNNFNNYFANSNLVGTNPGVTSTGNNSTVYTTGAINNYLNNVIGYTSASTPSAGKVSSQLSTLNSNAIKNITRSGTTFTATRINGTTFTFTQQDSIGLRNRGYVSKVLTNQTLAGNTAKSFSLTQLGSQDGDLLIPLNLYVGAATSGGGTWAYCSINGWSTNAANKSASVIVNNRSSSTATFNLVSGWVSLY